MGEVTRLVEFARSQPQANLQKLITKVDAFYENNAGYREPTAAFRACNLGGAYTIAHRM